MKRTRLRNIRSCNVRAEPILAKPLSEDRVRRSVLRILRANVLCSMATLTDDRLAHINTAYFSYSDELELYFLSHPSSLHCQNLAANASMAMTIFSSAQSWEGPDRGLQLFGTCRQARGHSARKAERLYGKRFAAYAHWKAALKRSEAARQYRFYRFVPGELKILDEKEFGDAVIVSAVVTRGA